MEFIGLNDSRPDDKFGIAAGYARVSRRAQALDADIVLFSIPRGRCAVSRGFSRPRINTRSKTDGRCSTTCGTSSTPGGRCHSSSSAAPGKVLHNATVLGLRTTLNF
ncbi:MULTISPECIES: carbohydrate porin [unclassified Bradyrhizobium]|uniref:carbohydrate porin n=1 Tax=unclassified Bradyrhizobium TaxID=2631580 RepID=UPI0020B2C950|nr:MULTISPECIES: carbohydrate porin [unclassified Bradyrhizobium]MCP3398918.1 carbohydrate porin [Bradyrhizobium sp. CCGB20]MCP3407519.1 carbohydrate porin [Bradyrhizobium sp. CCGB01]